MTKVFYAISIISFISSCALDGMFLYPVELHQEDRFSKYLEEFDDTISLSFDENSAPQFTNSSNQNVDIGFTIENVYIPKEDSTHLNAWLIEPTEYNGTTLFFLHGNAGNLVYQYGLATPFAKRGFKVFLIDYSGFGFSDGDAKRKNVLTDAQIGFDYLLSNYNDYDHLLIYGQSLGGHLAAVIGTLNQEKIDAMVIEGAFSSHKDVASDHVPILGRIFTREMYSGEKHIGAFQKPVLIIHSREDETVAYKHGEQLYKKATQPKSFYSIDQAHIRGPIYYLDSIEHKMFEMIKLED